MVEGRVVDTRFPFDVDGLHQVDFDRGESMSGNRDVFVDVLCFAPISPREGEAKQVDPKLAEPALVRRSDGDLLDPEHRKRPFWHGGPNLSGSTAFSNTVRLVTHSPRGIGETTMKKPIRIETGHRDLGGLIDYLGERIDDTSLMLSLREPIQEGEWVRFEILLFNGSPAFEGLGCCLGTIDNGASVAPANRYDVLLGDLQFDARNEVICERIRLASQGNERRGEHSQRFVTHKRQPQDGPAPAPKKAAPAPWRSSPSPASTPPPRSVTAEPVSTRPSSVPARKTPPFPGIGVEPPRASVRPPEPQRTTVRPPRDENVLTVPIPLELVRHVHRAAQALSLKSPNLVSPAIDERGAVAFALRIGLAAIEGLPDQK